MVNECDLGLLMRPEIGRNSCTGLIPFPDGGRDLISIIHPSSIYVNPAIPLVDQTDKFDAKGRASNI